MEWPGTVCIDVPCLFENDHLAYEPHTYMLCVSVMLDDLGLRLPPRPVPPATMATGAIPQTARISMLQPGTRVAVSVSVKQLQQWKLAMSTSGSTAASVVADRAEATVPSVLVPLHSAPRTNTSLLQTQTVAAQTSTQVPMSQTAPSSITSIYVPTTTPRDVVSGFAGSGDAESESNSNAILTPRSTRTNGGSGSGNSSSGSGSGSRNSRHSRQGVTVRPESRRGSRRGGSATSLQALLGLTAALSAMTSPASSTQATRGSTSASLTDRMRGNRAGRARDAVQEMEQQLFSLAVADAAEAGGSASRFLSAYLNATAGIVGLVSDTNAPIPRNVTPDAFGPGNSSDEQQLWESTWLPGGAMDNVAGAEGRYYNIF